MLKIYCLSLKERSDRRDKIQQQFKRYGLQVEWWIVDRHPLGGKYGCFESHLCIWEKHEGDITMIIEDDLEISINPEKFREILSEAIEISKKYPLICLGHLAISLESKVQGSAKFFEGKFLAMSCYLARTHTLRKLARLIRPYYGSQLDIVISNYVKQVGCIPPINKLSFLDSNNSWLDGIPIIESIPGLDHSIRQSLTHDSNLFLKIPPILVDRTFDILLGLSGFQRLCPTLLYNTTPEFENRRVFI